jgi:GT2 family glycosyltransferase
MKRTAIIILNWNNAADTVACLRSVTNADYGALEVVVVDNGSTDDSVACIRTAFPHMRIIETGCNLGYAGGNNVGIRQVLAEGFDFVCILNNDTTVEPSFLNPLIAVLAARPDVGIVTPLVAEQSTGAGVWALGQRVNRWTATVSREHAGAPVTAWRGCEPFAVEAASGAAMLVERSVFEQAGLMDERFFLYYEETDWCLRLRKLGIQIFAVPESVVHHRVSATLGQTSPVIDYYMTRNHFLLLCRTIGRQLLAVSAFTVKPEGGLRIPRRNARLLALRDAMRGRWGRMGADVASACNLSHQ